MKKILSTIYISIFIIIASIVPTFADDDGGAYDYLSEITQNYPYREFSKGGSYACGNYIINTLTDMGYEVKQHTFNSDDFYCDLDISSGIGRNIYVDIPGQSSKMILLCAHYDCADTEGCDDNASGMSVALALAKQLKNECPPCTVRIIFFDDEEDGYIGSGAFCKDQSVAFFEDLLFVVNIDSIAGGDNMYIHGGDATGGYTWARDYALSLASNLGLNYGIHPDVDGIPAGTRFGGSDQVYFARHFVPYIYIEANIYSDLAPDGNPVHYQTESPSVPNHQIMHTEYDNMSIINNIFPGRIKDHLSSCYKLCSELILHTDTNGSYTASGISAVPYTPSADHALLSSIFAYYDGDIVLGETVTPANFHVRSYYSDGSERSCSYWTCSGHKEPLHPGDNVISFYYTGFKYDLVITLEGESTEESTEEVSKESIDETSSIEMPTEDFETETEPEYESSSEQIETEATEAPIETAPSIIIVQPTKQNSTYGHIHKRLVAIPAIMRPPLPDYPYMLLKFVSQLRLKHIAFLI